MSPLVCVSIWYRKNDKLSSHFTFRSVQYSLYVHLMLYTAGLIFRFPIWLKFYLDRKMDEHDGCQGSTLLTVCLNCSLWEEQTQSLSYMDWIRRLSISIPQRIPTDSLHTRCWFHFILFTVAHHAIAPHSLLNLPDLWSDENWDTRLWN